MDSAFRSHMGTYLLRPPPHLCSVLNHVAPCQVEELSHPKKDSLQEQRKCPSCLLSLYFLRLKSSTSVLIFVHLVSKAERESPGPRSAGFYTFEACFINLCQSELVLACIHASTPQLRLSCLRRAEWWRCLSGSVSEQQQWCVRPQVHSRGRRTLR